MTNRAGKREREARNRHKRCRATLQIGGVGLTLKLGRKKEMALMRSNNASFSGPTVLDFISASHRVASWAVPVADSRKPAKKDEGEAHVS